MIKSILLVLTLTLAAQAQWISGVVASTPTTTSTTITWTTCAPASGLVSYGKTSAYGSMAGSGTLSTSHSVALTGLSPSTVYHFSVSSTDSTGVIVSVGKDFAILTATPPPPPPPPNTFILGVSTIFTTLDSGNANLLVAQKVTSTQVGTLQTESFYVVTPAGKVRLGVYDATGPAGNPGKKLAETAEITPVAGWNTGPVTLPVVLPAGTYWLVYFPSSNTLSFRVDRSTGSVARISNLTYQALPATFTANPVNSVSRWSFYATLSTTVVQPPPPVCNAPGVLVNNACTCPSPNTLVNGVCTVPPPPPPPISAFKIGDRVAVKSTLPSVNVRGSAQLSGTLLGAEVANAQGLVVGGPTASTTDTVIWLQVKYDDNLTGWTGDDNFIIATVPPPPPVCVSPGVIVNNVCTCPSPNTVVNGVCTAPAPPPPPVLKPNLSWTPSATTTVSGYNVYRSTTSGSGYAKVNNTLITSSAFVDSSATTGTYFYVATSFDPTQAVGSQESIFSNEIRLVVP